MSEVGLSRILAQKHSTTGDQNKSFQRRIEKLMREAKKPGGFPVKYYERDNSVLSPLKKSASKSGFDPKLEGEFRHP